MKTPSAKAFTLVELLAVIFVVVFLAVLLLPSLAHRGPATGIVCINNQHQIATGLFVWSLDHANKFPWQVASTNGGALEAAIRGYAAPNFQCLSNYTSGATMIYICRADTNRVAAKNIAQLRNLNISYFISFDSGTEASASILTGDRNLAHDGNPLYAGLYICTPTSKMNWTRGLHTTNPKWAIGALSFIDGHAEMVKDADLNSVFLRENLATNRLCIP